MAEVCNRVPMFPPRNFREAIQSFWFTYLLGHLEGSHLGYSPGRLDIVLFPWFEADKNARFEETVALFEELFVKMTQIEYIASLSWQGLGHGNLYQNLILGGADENNQPASNEISMAILQAQINMQMTQPTLSVWWDDRLDKTFLMKAAECVKTGVGYPAFFNQKTYIRHESDTSHLPVGVIRKHSAMGGCTEPTLQGMSYGIVQAGFVNHGKIIDPEKHRECTGRSNKVILDNLACLSLQMKRIIIRFPLIPGIADDSGYPIDRLKQVEDLFVPFIRNPINN